MDRYYGPYPYYVRQRKPYSFANLLFDILLLILTQGLWIIWILVRQFRRR